MDAVYFHVFLLNKCHLAFVTRREGFQKGYEKPVALKVFSKGNVQNVLERFLF